MLANVLAALTVGAISVAYLEPNRGMPTTGLAEAVIDPEPDSAVASSTAQRLFESLRQEAGDDDDRLAAAATARTEYLLEHASYAKALRLAELALDASEEAFGPDDLRVARLADLLGRCHHVTASFEEARSHLTRALIIRETALGPEHPEVAESLDHLGDLLWELANRDAARASLERALAIREKHYGPEHPSVADSYHDLCRFLEDPERALDLCERALAIRERVLGPKHPDVADSLLALGWALDLADEQRELAPLYERALTIYRTAYGSEHPAVADTLSLLYLPFGDYAADHEASRRGMQRVLAIRKAAFGPDHPLVGVSLGQLGWSIAGAEGRYEEGLLLLKEALTLLERAYGPDHPDVGRTLRHLGWTTMSLGEYAEAKAIYERAMALDAKIRNPFSKFGAVLELAYLHSVMGDYDAAEPLYLRALAIAELRDALVPWPWGLSQAVYHLGRFYYLAGKLDRAEPLLERALAIRESLLGPDIARLAFVLNYLGRLRADLGRFTEARADLERALRLLEANYGADHDETGQTLHYLAILLRDAGRAGESMAVLERSIGIAEREPDPMLPQLAERLSLLATVQFDLGRHREAIDTALRAESKGLEHLRVTTRALSERAALRYAAVRGSGLDVALTVLASGLLDDPGTLEQVWQAVIASRAVVLEEMVLRQRRATAAGPAAERLARARQELAALMVRGAGRDSPDDRESSLAAAKREVEEAEEALARATRGSDVFDTRPSLDALRDNLPAGSGLVAFVRYEHLARIDQVARVDSPRRRRSDDGPGAVPSYAAFVTTRDSDPPELVPLGPADAIERAVAGWSWEASRGLLAMNRTPEEATRAYHAAARTLRELSWDPPTRHLGDVHRIFVVPDGALHLVSFDALSNDDGSFLLEGTQWIHQLTAERDLAASKREITGEPALLALGDPSFDATKSFATLGPSERRIASGAGAAGYDAVREGVPAEAIGGKQADCADFRSLRFEPVPDTGREVEAIARMWRERRTGSGSGSQQRRTTSNRVTMLTGARATETAFKRLAPGHKLLHLATHGFFLGDVCVVAPASTRGLGGLVEVGESSLLEHGLPEPPSVASSPPESTEANPLRLSGLALAGANHRERAGHDEDDGILTAEEIASLDLSGVEWAVLSACDTGLGKVETGEGVFGLRRAFQTAGVRTLIMSLWSVDDESTRRWMTALYEARLRKGLSTAESVRHASVSVLEARREAGWSTHPFHWAAFVAAGDWR